MSFLKSSVLKRLLAAANPVGEQCKLYFGTPTYYSTLSDVLLMTYIILYESKHPECMFVNLQSFIMTNLYYVLAPSLVK
jgi:hypothetical protein